MADARNQGEPPATPAGLDDLADQLSELARTLQGREGVDDTLLAIVHAAVGTVPGAHYAGISVVEGRKSMSTPVLTDELVSDVDQAQLECHEGPCLDALYEKHTVLSPDLTREQRWPRFAARAADLGILSMLSFQLYVHGDDLGALNLYARHTDAFDEEAVQTGRLFAAHAAVAMADAQQIEHLTRALTSRDTIGQAKGILMERYKVNGDHAFALLVHISKNTNTKVAQIADHLVHSGELPERT